MNWQQQMQQQINGLQQQLYSPIQQPQQGYSGYQQPVQGFQTQMPSFDIQKLISTEVERQVTKLANAAQQQMQQLQQQPAEIAAAQQVNILSLIGASLSQEDQVWLSGNLGNNFSKLAEFLQTGHGKETINNVLAEYKGFCGVKE